MTNEELLSELNYITVFEPEVMKAYGDVICAIMKAKGDSPKQIQEVERWFNGGYKRISNRERT